MDDVSWNRFVRDCLERKRSFLGQERVAALEALLVLLFHRMKVHRADLAVIVTAFFNCSDMTTMFAKNTAHDGTDHRLSRLAGLLCAESMALWRIFSIDGDDDEDNSENRFNHNTNSNNNNMNAARTDWRKRHPLLEQVGETNQAECELHALELMLREAGIKVEQRLNKQVDANQPEAPEALALLSFGL